MHSLILITALSATTGLFGGKHCGQAKHHARRAVSSCYSAAAAPSPCGGSYVSPYGSPQAMPMTSGTPQGYPTSPAKMAPPTQSVPPAPPAPVGGAPTPSPSSALSPTGQPIVATGDLR